MPLAGLAPDGPFPFGEDDLAENRFSNSRARLLVAEARREGLTLRQSAARFAAGRGYLVVIGTGEAIARRMREWVEAGAADGFDVMPPLLPDGIGVFGAQVMPSLVAATTTNGLATRDVRATDQTSA